MSRQFFLLLDVDSAEVWVLERGDIKRLGGVHIGADGTQGESTADRIATSIHELGYRSGRIGVLFSDALCLPLTAEVDRPIARSNSALSYALEESFPVEIERLLVGIAEGPGKRLAVGLDLRGWGETLSGLAGRGIRIGAINSLGLLRFQNDITKRLKSNRLPDDPVVWWHKTGDTCNCILSVSRRPVAWTTVSAEGMGNGAIPFVLEMFAGHEPPRRLEELPAIDGADSSVDSGMLEFATHCLTGSVDPWVEFPTDRFSGNTDFAWRSPAAAIGVCILLAVVMSGVGLWARAMQYRALRQETTEALDELFTANFSGRRRPQDIRRTLAGMLESRKSMNDTGQLAASSDRLLHTLADVVLALPPAEAETCAISSLTVEPGIAQVRGDAPSVDVLQSIEQSMDSAGFRTEFGQVRSKDFSLTVRNGPRDRGEQ